MASTADSRRALVTLDHFIRAETDTYLRQRQASGAFGTLLFINVTPERNDGTMPHRLRVREVPVDGFWSISVYNAEGYFEANPHGGYSLNNLTAGSEPDGSFEIRFGGSPEQPNWLHIAPGWNYTVRLYLPRQECLEGRWQFPAATPLDTGCRDEVSMAGMGT
jgi:hypothetical protein